MSDFTKNWDANSPQGSDAANTLDTVIQDMKSALGERLGLEHQPMSNTNPTSDKDADLRHKPGFVGTVFRGTTAEIDALKVDPYPGNGSLAWDTDTKELKLYDSATNSWKSFSSIAFPNASDRLDVYDPTDLLDTATSPGINTVHQVLVNTQVSLHAAIRFDAAFQHRSFHLVISPDNFASWVRVQTGTTHPSTYVGYQSGSTSTVQYMPNRIENIVYTVPAGWYWKIEYYYGPVALNDLPNYSYLYLGAYTPFTATELAKFVNVTLTTLAL